jgi:hypothetical protein
MPQYSSSQMHEVHIKTSPPTPLLTKDTAIAIQGYHPLSHDFSTFHTIVETLRKERLYEGFGQRIINFWRCLFNIFSRFQTQRITAKNLL